MRESEPFHLPGKPEPQGWGRQWCLSASFLIVSFFSFNLVITFVTSGTCWPLPSPFTNRYKLNDKSLGLWLPYQCANHGAVSSPETGNMFVLSPSLAVTMACFHTVIIACHFPPLVLRVWDKVLTSTVWGSYLYSSCLCNIKLLRGVWEATTWHSLQDRKFPGMCVTFPTIYFWEFSGADPNFPTEYCF